MKKLFKGIGSILSLLALLLLVLAFIWLLRGRAPTGSVSLQSPLPTPTSPRSTPTPPRATPTPPPSRPVPAPRCTFAGLPAPEVSEPSLEAYVFSEPQVVLTHTSSIGIADWLPDGQRLLITRDIPGTNCQTIETFNAHTGEIQVYAQREGANGKPIWLSELRGVAYSTLAGQQHELWISWGEPTQAERIVPRVDGLSLAVTPDGQRLLYFSSPASSQPQLWDVAAQVTRPMPLDLARWKYPKYPRSVQPRLTPFQAAWHPNGSQVVFYTQPWTFLFDMKANQVCEIDLGRSEAEDVPIWALEAKWSPDGRYLALITTGSFPGQASGTRGSILYTDLTILDARTGDLHTLQPAPDINPGQHYVTDITWAPNSQVIAARAVVKEKEGIMYEGLYLAEAADGQSNRILPETVFTGGDAGWSLAWSPDGHRLVLSCPTRNEGRLCTITVTTQGK